MYQFLCYYQREIALWMYHNLDTRAADICLDTELAAAFKVRMGAERESVYVGVCLYVGCGVHKHTCLNEWLSCTANTLTAYAPHTVCLSHSLCCVVQEGWCKKCFPDQKIFSTYKCQPQLPDDSTSSGHGGGGSTGSSKRSSSSATSPRTSNTGPSSSSSTSPSGGTGTSSRTAGGSSSGGLDGPTPCLEAAAGAASAEQVAALTAAADALGVLLQNHHQVSFLQRWRRFRGTDCGFS